MKTDEESVHSAPSSSGPGGRGAIPAGGTEAAGIVALGLSAGGADPGLNEEPRSFLRKQNEIADKQGTLADCQAELLARRIESSAIEQEHVEAQNRHLAHAACP